MTSIMMQVQLQALYLPPVPRNIYFRWEEREGRKISRSEGFGVHSARQRSSRMSVTLSALAAFVLEILLLTCDADGQGTRPVFPVTVGDCCTVHLV